MKLRLSLAEISLIAIVVAGVATAVWRLTAPGASAAPERPGVSAARVVVPDYSAIAKAGLVGFEANCVRCHGSNGTGTNQGPPLLHDIYNPGHHPDGSFVSAVRQGVRRHHWNFGDMPPQPQVSDREIADIVRYMRELQVANGIVHREHRM